MVTENYFYEVQIRDATEVRCNEVRLYSQDGNLFLFLSSGPLLFLPSPYACAHGANFSLHSWLREGRRRPPRKGEIMIIITKYSIWSPVSWVKSETSILFDGWHATSMSATVTPCCFALQHAPSSRKVVWRKRTLAPGGRKKNGALWKGYVNKSNRMKVPKLF